MIKVHAFYNFNTFTWVTFVFQHTDGTCYTFNSDCWEDGKPVIRKSLKVNYDIMGIRLTHHDDGWYNAPLLTIQMENGDEFSTTVDEHQEFTARGGYYLGVANKPLQAKACAFGNDRGLRGWATRGNDFRRFLSVRNVHVRLADFGLHVGRESGSDITYPEEYGWVLDYSTGKLIEGVGTENQMVTSS